MNRLSFQRKSRRSRRMRLITILLLQLLLCVSSTSFSVAQDDDDCPDTASETNILSHQEQDELMLEIINKTEAERIARERPEQERKRMINQQEREAAFTAEIAKMSATERKAARMQKKKDARIVRRILRAAEHDNDNPNHYAVLGLRNWEPITSSCTMKLVSLALRMPEVALFRIEPEAIQEAYRILAMAVHPDKNRDGRAEEAFIAVENSAFILTDETQRIEYDNSMREMRRNRRKEATPVQVFRRVLGPFCLTVFILGSIFI
jgi:hypothetical protein